MKTLKQHIAACDAIERRLVEWWDKYNDALSAFETVDGVPLKDAVPNNSHDGSEGAPFVSDILTKRGTEIYEVDEEDSVRRNVTKQALKKLRRMEEKIAEWIDKSYEAEAEEYTVE